ncbi:MAG: glycosyltransferase family 2 protein [Xanthobacteraceae bacterium]|nr:glycosyltransferase family 2 protein [Xanthobacteraceae bacterium]
MAELISIIVATYNRPDALDAVLRGLSRQGDRGFEIVVADDGSGPATRQVAESWETRAGVPVRHVWHEDRGFRLAEIRNRAIAASRGEVCVFLDGDSIPRPGFVAAHRRLAEPGWFVAGNRVLLSQGLTERVLREGATPELWRLGDWIAARRAGDVNRLGPVLTLPLGPLRRLRARAWEGARGGNLAIRRADLLRVDGFDAEFSGWGLEDSDVIVRLLRSGTRRKDGWFATGVVHLWHPEHDRARLAGNRARLDEVIGADRVRALRGISALEETGTLPQDAAPRRAG